eukprot:10586389-Alexandrium_andersonii.AAC.1
MELQTRHGAQPGQGGLPPFANAHRRTAGDDMRMVAQTSRGAQQGQAKPPLVPLSPVQHCEW